MGFLSDLFSGPSDYDRNLEETHVQVFLAMGMPLSQARSQARALIKQAKEELRRTGAANTPPDFGDQLLRTEALDPSVGERFAIKRQEGVTDSDIRWWWNLPPIERTLMEKVDELNRMALFLHCLKQGFSPDQAAARMRQFHPMFGDPTDTTHTNGEDRPLPIELKDRINRYIEKRATSDPATYKKDLDHCSTFNALIRQAIRIGQI